jgi:dihydrofolate reductase
MAELTLDFITSLDGFGAAEGWPGLWGMGSQEYLDWLGEEAKVDYAVLMGATTYRLFVGFAEQNPEWMEDLARRTKFVFSRTLETPLFWDNAKLVDEDAVDAVASLKKDSDVPLRTLGSLSLCRSLLTAGLVDRYRVVVFPVVNGATGRDRIYADWPDVRLDLVDARTFEGGLQLLEFVPEVLDGPPGAD